jgi:hypothetical protein
LPMLATFAICSLSFLRRFAMGVPFPYMPARTSSPTATLLVVQSMPMPWREARAISTPLPP